MDAINVGTPCAVCAYELGERAVVLLDRDAQVLRVNSGAERLLGVDYKIVNRRLCSVYGKATAVLNSALNALIESNELSFVFPPILLPRTNQGPLLADATRPPAICQHMGAPCQAVLVLIDPSTRYLPPELHLKAFFSLSTAEARLAQLIASGEALEVAADHLGISKHTARAQLKAVFAKTSVHRQGELVSLLTKLSDLPSLTSYA